MRARLAEIVAKLDEFKGVEFSAEQVTEVNGLHSEFTGLKASIETAEKMAEINAGISTSTRKVTPAATVAPVVANKHKATGGFASLGEFAKGVQKHANGDSDTRFQNATVFEGVGEDGGILVPKEFLTDIKTKFESQESLLAKTSQFAVSGNSLSMPIDEEQPWNGGVSAYWTAEGNQITGSKPVLSEADFKLKKLAAMVKVNEELLEDSAAIESIIRRKAPNAMVSKVNGAIINGDGVGKPQGILGSGFTLSVAKEAAQAADTLVYKNIIKMEARLLPGSQAVWLAHPQCKEQLRQLKDDNGNHIYMNGAQFPNLAEAGFDTLLGKPVVYMAGAMPALGDQGDLILADLSYYYSLVKSNGIKQAASTHLYFDRDQTAFKFTMRLDGHCPFKTPVTTEFGGYEMSGLITLATRA